MEAFRLAAALGDSVWPGWSTAPFAVLLVTRDHEFLIRHPSPSPDFTPQEFDSLLGSRILTRPWRFPPNLLATFPAVGGVPTIVIGEAEATGKSSASWVLTVLHEHFHQLQMSRPDYYPAVNALELSGGDQTGRWMLEYPFPYDSARVQERFAAVAATLRTALRAAGTPSFPEQFAAHLAARRALTDALSPADARYLAFQLWQEGVARYTEVRLARLAARRWAPSPAFQALPDFVPFRIADDSLGAGIDAGLDHPRLSESKRTAFYPLGAASALLLDESAPPPGWQARYFTEMFQLERYFAPH